MDIKVGRHTLALFSDPFNGDKEELLFVDDQNQLRWLRHTNGGSGDPSLEPAEWVVEWVEPDIDQVVVAVHPQGGVWAFGLSAFRGFVTAFELVQDADGRTRWVPATIKGWPGGGEAGMRLLPVQYLADRPTTPLVFAAGDGQSQDAPHIFAFSPMLRGPDQPFAWRSQARVSFDPLDRGSDLVAGYDDSTLESLRVYALHTKGGLWTTRWVGSERPTRQRLTDGVPWYTLSGWTTESGFGAVGVTVNEIMGQQDLLGYCPAPDREGTDQDVVWRLPLDQRVDDVEAWQDAETRLHLYGRAADGGLHAIHQLNWRPSEVEGCSIPVWDTHSATRGATVTTRALLEKVARFNVDAYPDDMPSQHVMHSGVPEGESCVIYTQSVTTTFWAREKVRLVQQNPEMYSVPRYQSTLTVFDAYGGPLPQWPVRLTSDSGVDLEINGMFYRTGPVAPVVVNTDGAGRITIRIVASGLSIVPIEASCNGLAQNVSINPAADVHRFLGGTGTLPNHSAGFNADVIEGAKTPSGDPLFPKIRPKASQAGWPPSAEEVAAWCRGVFAVSGGQDLSVALSTSASRPTQVAGFSIQTFDPTRPGFSVFATAEDLAARRAAIAGQVMSWDGGSEWLGDLWQGICNGVLAVAEVVVNVAESVIELVVQLADAIFVTVSAAWDDIVSAAHAVEAAFVAIGAAIMDAVHWLQQLFGLEDAWHTMEAVQAQFASVVPDLHRMLTRALELEDGWFSAKRKEIHDAFQALKPAVQGRSAGALQAPAALPGGGHPPGTTSSGTDQVKSPHAAWFMDKVNGSAKGAVWSMEETPAVVAVGDAFDEFVAAVLASPAWDDVTKTFGDIGQLFLNLFDGSDPATLASTELSALIDILEDIVDVGIDLLDTILKAAIKMAQTILSQFEAISRTEIDGGPVINAVWDWIQDAAGVEDKRPMNFADVSGLLAAYPFTIVYKAVHEGEAPFPKGWMPPGVLGALPGQSGYTDGPVSRGIGILQDFQGFCMAMDSIPDSLANATAVVPADSWVNPPEVFWKICGVLHTVAYGGLDYPPLWGSPWPDHLDENSLIWWSWLMTAIVNLGDMGCAFKNKVALRMWDDKRGVGPGLMSVAGIAREIMSGARFHYQPQNSTDVFNLMINLTAFFSSATGFVRILFRAYPESQEVEVAYGLKMILDAVCDLFAGIGTIYQTEYEFHNPPTINIPDLPAAAVGFPYSASPFTGSGGWIPYTWTVENGPQWLTIDVNTGALAGTPDLAGKADFKVRLDDYFGPTWTVWTQSLQIEIVD